VLLFDGVCNLCNGFINFIIDHDPEGYFKFAPLQSEVAAEKLADVGLTNETLDSVVMIEDGRCYRRSTAALMVSRRLGGVWAWLYVFMVVPRPLRDLVYDWVATNRYRWFGKRESCRMPTPELQARFLA
jgi:predicted DCC family thiol-disulfide oxidoreductase YuxK